MADNRDLLELATASARKPGSSSRFLKDHEDDEESCGAFGFLRGLQDKALAIEFRFRNGNADTFAYSHLASWRFNPSIGLLLKFTSDVTTLALIAGSNLNLTLPSKSINLTDRGLQRHRITYVREMDEDELRKAGTETPTIDHITVADFQSVEAQEEWLKKTAPALRIPEAGAPDS